MASVTSDREADRAAVVLDFRDFTEDLPADLLRSLNLIRTLNERCNRYMTRYNELVKTYQTALDIPERERPSTGNILREMIRLQEQNHSCRQTSAAEAARFHDTIEMNYHRMTNIHEQLKVLPKPPSRDPTPEPLPPTEVQRQRAGRNPQALILNPPNPSRYATNGIPKKTLKISMGVRPGASANESDDERNTAASARKQTPSQKAAKRPPRPPREPTRGPRVSASVPEPPKPPEDALPGSEHKPWTRLTEWEMWKLRKKMKKNSGWEPSPVMVKRTLVEGGRGDENYQAAKSEAEAKGIELLDCDREKRDPPPVVEVTPPKPPPPQGTIEVVGGVQNRSLKLNESKKVKRDQIAEERARDAEERAREQAQNAARETEQAAKRLSDMGQALKKVFNLSNLLPDRAASSPVLNSSGKVAVKKEPSTGKKRKAESLSTVSSPSVDVQKIAAKKRKPDTSPMPVPPLVATTSAPPSSAPSTLNASARPTPLGDPVNLGLQMPLPSSGSTTLSSPGSPKRPSSPSKQTSVAQTPEPTPPPLAPAPRSSSRRSTRLSSASSTENAAQAEDIPPKAAPPPTPPPPPAPAIPSTTRVLRGASTPVLQKPAMKEKTEQETVENDKIPTHRPPTAEPVSKTIVTAASERSKRRVPGTITQSNEDGGAKVSVAGGGRRAAAMKAGHKEGKVGAQGKGGKGGGYWRTDVDGNKEWINTDEHELYCLCQDVSYGQMIACELEETVSKVLSRPSQRRKCKG